MPRGKSQPKPGAPKVVQPPRFSPQDDEWGGFVSVKVDEPGKELFNLWYSENMQNIPALLTDALADGLKLSVSWDGGNQSMIATFTGRPCESADWPFRCSLSARAADFWEAVALLCYKEYVVTGRDWTPWTVNGRRLDTWG